MIVREYYKLTKPGIVYGNLLSLIGGFIFASGGHVDIELFVPTVIGAGMIIGSACAINNFTDQLIDSKMKRTKNRPLVTHTISPRNATIFAFIWGFVGFVTLGLLSNIYALACGAIAYFYYTTIYAYFKRKSLYGTLVGTVPGSLPILAGYLTANGGFDKNAWILFLIMACWQMAHFYAIALFRKTDYKKADIPVFPLVKGDSTTRQHIKLWIMAFGACCVLLATVGTASPWFGMAMIVTTIWWLVGAQKTINDSVQWGRKVFGRSLFVLLFFSLLLCLDSWLA